GTPKPATTPSAPSLGPDELCHLFRRVEMDVVAGPGDRLHRHLQMRKAGAQLGFVRERSGLATDDQDRCRRLRADELEHRLADRERRVRTQEGIPFPGE